MQPSKIFVFYVYQLNLGNFSFIFISERQSTLFIFIFTRLAFVFIHFIPVRSEAFLRRAIHARNILKQSIHEFIFFIHSKSSDVCSVLRRLHRG